MVWVAVGYVRGSQNAVCGFCMCIWGGVAKWPAEKVRKCDERMGRKNASGRRWQRGEGKRKGKRYWEKKKASTREVWAVLDFFLQRVDYFESVPFVDNSFLDTLIGNRLSRNVRSWSLGGKFVTGSILLRSNALKIRDEMYWRGGAYMMVYMVTL